MGEVGDIEVLHILNIDWIQMAVRENTGRKRDKEVWHSRGASGTLMRDPTALKGPKLPQF